MQNPKLHSESSRTFQIEQFMSNTTLYRFCESTKKYVVVSLLAGVATAMAASGKYKVSVLRDATVAGQQIKAGDYKVAVENNTATLSHGKESVTVPAHTETAESKFPVTSIRYVANTISEIHVGGTTTRIVFSGEPSNTRAGGSN